MRHHLIRPVLITVITLTVLYLTLMISFRSPSPLDMLHYIASNGWSLDSAKVDRRVHHLREYLDHEHYGTTADSAWDFGISVFGRNLVPRSMNIDSIVVLNLEANVSYRVDVFQHRVLNSPKIVNPDTIVGRQSFEAGGYVDDGLWRMNGNRGLFQDQFDAAFLKRAFQVRVHSSRGVQTITPSHYITRGHYLEWTVDVRVAHD